jgi:hypothetical protein
LFRGHTNSLSRGQWKSGWVKKNIKILQWTKIIKVMAEYLKSIEKVEKIFGTACKPVLVHANDLNFYVCKYNTSSLSANMLFREWMCSSFLKIWELKIPEFDFIYLQKHHNPDSLKNINNDMACFGVLYNNEYREIDAFITGMGTKQKRRFADKTDILRIALFDYWISNEDRNHNNYNLMLQIVNEEYRIISIDGGSVFHTGNQDKENYTLSKDESILSSPLLFSLFRVKELCKPGLLEELKEYYYFCIRSCKQSFEETINKVPPSWQINKPKEVQNLERFLFNEDWINEVWETFTQHLQISLNKK